MNQPNAIDAEQALLGALMANNRTYPRVRDLGLSPAHFVDPLNGVLYDELENMICDGECADAVSVLPRLLELGIWDRETWVTYLCGLLTLILDHKTISARILAQRIIATWIVRRQS
jgi:replicative DNA helicase